DSEQLSRHIRSMIGRRRADQVLQRFGLSIAEAHALRQYLGINSRANMSPERPKPATNEGEFSPGTAPALPSRDFVTEFASRAGVQIQTVRNRILKALHCLAVPHKP